MFDNQLSNYWTSSGLYDEIFYYVRNDIKNIRNDLALKVIGERVNAKIGDFAAVSMELKTKMDFWDTLYAALFGVMFLMNITDVAWLLLIAVFLYTGYGKVLNLKMKNGLNFEIPVNGMTEDVEQFRLLIGKE